MNYASIIIPFVGGLGMFIYGMQIMAQGLENAAGSRMKSLLEALTKNKLFGVMLGAFITAVIQSSSATTVMVVGFVNAGIMNLSQAMGVIMGANIGTTVTGWLVSSVEWAKFLSPANLAPIAIIIGVIIMLTGKRRSSKDISSIIVGFGILFVGINDVVGGCAASGIRSILQHFREAWTQSVPWYSCRCACDGDHPEFVCICRHFTGAVQYRRSKLRMCDTDYHGTEHWYMCDSDYFISRSIEKCKADSISTFVF